MPSDETDRTAKTALAVLSLVVLAYSLVIVQQILLGVLAVVALWGIYLLWRLIRVLERIAGSLELRAAHSDGGPLETDGQREVRESERELDR